MATGQLLPVHSLALNQSVLDRVSQEAQDEIVPRMWVQPTASSPSLSRDDWTSYFSYYSRECYLATTTEVGRYSTARTHQDVLVLIFNLNWGPKGHVRQALRSLIAGRTLQHQEERIEAAIILMTRLLTMVDIGPRLYSPREMNSVQWKDESVNLKQLLSNHFVPQALGQSDTGYSRDLTAYNLHKYAGLEFEWTDNLADHLRLTDNGNKLTIFSHATFLRWTGEYVHLCTSNRHATLLTANCSYVLPEGLAAETFQTLAVLFPRSDFKAREWFKAEFLDHLDGTEIDSQVLECDERYGRHSNDLRYWRKEMNALQAILDNPKPKSIFQLFKDRRNPVQWYTFWVAILVFILTIFFGLAQSVFSAIQVYKAYHPSKAGN